MFTFLQPAFLYLYFPEDKTEYIPVVIEFLVLLVICIFVFRWFKKKSARDAEKAKVLEEKIMQMRKEELEKQSSQ
ncbi:hypothetical protein OR571_04820 [Psychrobacillus sp. NEAU-3TGS]|uniref:hypothetical protein n=1 Tax=Psychrobacillus sp. NEAU-3TGS TaxID=2995412 RepID=UPI0024978635|nr:hypothetical protein [Psychrobacillus sp. NEAU-3TGS]MDI2586470.1 hypothetical protein [Psychrobacillus sp. NEAU-3TGS]